MLNQTKTIVKMSSSILMLLFASLFASLFIFSSCNKDEDMDKVLKTKTFNYQFHNGQIVPSAPYIGPHPANLSAKMRLEELSNGNTKITVTIENSVNDKMYNIHAHDSADANSTPNGTPYLEAPNSSIFVQGIMGNGGSIMASQEADKSFEELTTKYAGFFVIHDPMQGISTSNISTFLIVSSFARDQTDKSFSDQTFNYDFNTGQIAAAFAYDGTHAANLSASINVVELDDNRSRVTVRIMNTLDEKIYHTHAHDVADPTKTPNGTPYNEMPNSDVFVAAIQGNGGTSVKSIVSSKSYSEITNSYEGFFVIHDPLQAISTTNPKSYVVLGSFAR